MKETYKTAEEILSSLPSRRELEARYEQSAGDKIREARQQKGISQKKLAELTGITAPQLCRIENGESRPSKNTLQKLSGYISIPYPELLRLAGYSNKRGDAALFTRKGEKLDTDALVSSIYRADSDLLESFRGFDEFGTPENIEAMKVMLFAMRKEEEIRRSGNYGQDNYFFMNTFKALKRFIVSTLAPDTIENS